MNEVAKGRHFAKQLLQEDFSLVGDAGKKYAYKLLNKGFNLYVGAHVEGGATFGAFN